jgi:hypothetical protein
MFASKFRPGRTRGQYQACGAEDHVRSLRLRFELSALQHERCEMSLRQNQAKVSAGMLPLSMSPSWGGTRSCLSAEAILAVSMGGLERKTCSTLVPSGGVGYWGRLGGHLLKERAPCGRIAKRFDLPREGGTARAQQDERETRSRLEVVYKDASASVKTRGVGDGLHPERRRPRIP